MTIVPDAILSPKRSVAQMVERTVRDREAGGSSPPTPTLESVSEKRGNTDSCVRQQSLHEPCTNSTAKANGKMRRGNY